MKPNPSILGAFKRLHENGCFVIPNPWDVGSARLLEAIGFKALATTSSGFAFAHGLPDSTDRVPRDKALGHYSEIAGSVGIPVSADFLNGYSASIEGLVNNVRLVIETGVAGFSLEDMTTDPSRPLMDVSQATERIAAARSVIDSLGLEVTLTARAECYLVGHPDPLRESIKRLEAYAVAGADVLFAPGVIEKVDVREVVKAVSPKAVNVIVSSNTGITVAELADLGVRRISTGSALFRAAWTALDRTAKEIHASGTFGGFEGSLTYGELSQFFKKG